ncbi:LPS assembly protein LptD [Photobacterium sagamiensis]|uniref:LPS assembly protein LptD n=1 Tax=Photobacterium sagamiensis TaxID=2910241 RepID=UPI003D0E1329
MSLTSRSLLATMISLALYGPVMADETPTPSDDVNDKLTVTGEETDELELVRGICIAPQDRSADPNNEPIKVTADHAEAKTNTKMTYSGDVVVQQGHRTMAADMATLRQPENIVTAEGNVYFHDGGMEVYSERLQSNLDSEDAEMDNAVYSMTCEPGRGEASRITKKNVQGTQFYRMKDGTYTTCPTDDNSWRFSATTLEREGESPFADLYNARFEVLDVPVFYLPYLRVPVGKERLTGFLYPSLSYGSRDGFEFETPFYWNIAPNYDMTITPKYMSNRGLQLKSNFRYLTEVGRGELNGEYLGDDKTAPEQGARWAFNWSHTGTYQEHWLFKADYSKTSDFSYFNDIDSSIGNREDNNLLQTGEVSYRDQNWDSTLRVRDFQPLTSTGEGTQYRLMPQLEFNYYRPDLPYGFDFSMASHISRFENDSNARPSADRVHLEPMLTLPYATPWWSITSEAKLMYTYYNQDFDKSATDLSTLDETVSRTVPSVRIHSGLYLERDTALWGDSYTQSLEPQIQYLFIQDVDQSGIYNPVTYSGGGYDSTRLQQDYYGLFSDKIYSSVDYIAPANQFTLGASTRYFDNNFKERFTLSLGQIFYIDKPTFDGTSEDDAESYSATALETEFNYADWLFFKSSMQYDASDSKVQLASGAIEYRTGGIYIQPNYRYVSSSYLDRFVANPNEADDSGKQDGISQLGLSTGFPLYDGLSLRADYFHDLNVNKMLESQVGLTYRSACWLIGLTYNQYASTSLGLDSTDYESNVTLSFSLLGLQGAKPLGYSTDTGNALSYGNSFSLNN